MAAARRAALHLRDLGQRPRRHGQERVEDAIEARVAMLRDEATSEKRMAVARGRVHAELVFDVETTEDAAHQLAFYAGLNALGSFLAMPQAIDRTTAEQVQDIAVRYLQPHQRTIGWYHAGKPVTIAQIASPRQRRTRSPRRRRPCPRV